MIVFGSISIVTVPLRFNGIFGSAVRGNFGADSDIDVLQCGTGNAWEREDSKMQTMKVLMVPGLFLDAEGILAHRSGCVARRESDIDPPADAATCDFRDLL